MGRNACFWLLAPALAGMAIMPLPLAAQCLPEPIERFISDLPGDIQFGLSLAISGDWAVAGAPLDNQQGDDAGAAFVFRRVNGDWSLHSKLVATDPAQDDMFGIDVDIDGATIVVGARNHNHGGLFWQYSGAGYVFELEGSQWIQKTELQASDYNANSAGLADTVAISGTTIALGSAFDDLSCSSGTDSDCGSVYVYVQPGSSWAGGGAILTQTTKLISCYPQPAQFGDEISLDGKTLVVGAWRDDNDSAENSGAVYVFEEPAVGGWAQGASCSAVVVQSLPQPESSFGISLGVQEDPVAGDRIVIGAWSQSEPSIGTASGAAYLVEEPPGGWSSVSQPILASANLLSSQVSAFDYYGHGVAIDGERIVVGSTQDDIPGASDSGRAFVFEKQGSDWVETHWLQVQSPELDGIYAPSFGYGLAIEGGTVFASAIDEDDAIYGDDSGAVYVFELAPCYVHLYCFCDGDGICRNPDRTSGCENSTGPGGLFYPSSGSTSVSLDDLVLSAIQHPPNQSGLIYMGGAQVELPFGDGFRCVGGGSTGLFRFGPPQNSGPFGQIVFGPGIVERSHTFSNPAGWIDPGETWYFQGWYRDPMGPCGTGFNLTNGLAATFQP